MKINVANMFTWTRILSIPLFVWVLKNSNIPHNEWVATAVFLFASLTDYFDGFFARKRKEATRGGKFLDLIADKLLVGAALICLIGNVIKMWMVVLIILREILVMIGRWFAESRGKKTEVSKLGKWKAVTQYVGIILVILGLPFAKAMMLLAVAITVVSGVDYFRKLKHVLSE